MKKANTEHKGNDHRTCSNKVCFRSGAGGTKRQPDDARSNRASDGTDRPHNARGDRNSGPSRPHNDTRGGRNSGTDRPHNDVHSGSGTDRPHNDVHSSSTDRPHSNAHSSRSSGTGDSNKKCGKEKHTAEQREYYPPFVLRRIISLRKKHHLTQSVVAAHLGMTQSTYSRCERGLVPLQVQDFVRLAKLYDVSLDYITGASSLIKCYPRK